MIQQVYNLDPNWKSEKEEINWWWGHSIWASATILLYTNGFSDPEIKFMLWWKSDAFHIYLQNLAYTTRKQNRAVNMVSNAMTNFYNLVELSHTQHTHINQRAYFLFSPIFLLFSFIFSFPPTRNRHDMALLCSITTYSLPSDLTFDCDLPTWQELVLHGLSRRQTLLGFYHVIDTTFYRISTLLFIS